MPISAYLADLRRDVGHRLLVLPAVAAIARTAQGRIVVGRRTDNGAWELPGGALDPGESPAQALVRETYEETGFICRPTRLIAVMTQRFLYPNGDQVEYTTSYFGADVVRGEARALDGENSEIQIVEAAVARLLLPPRIGELLDGEVGGARFDWEERWLDVDLAPA